MQDLSNKGKLSDILYSEKIWFSSNFPASYNFCCMLIAFANSLDLNQVNKIRIQTDWPPS